jgi:hypothetical protein
MHIMPVRPVAAFITAALVLATTMPALADAIDGDWCHPDGRRFSIRGAALVTPAGTAMTGTYSRHFFSYLVPISEPGAGQTIFMTLYSENVVHLQLGESGSREIWNRCLPSVSVRSAPDGFAGRWAENTPRLRVNLPKWANG